MIVYKEFILRKTGKRAMVNIFNVGVAADMSDVNGRFTRLILKGDECDYMDLSCNYDEFAKVLGIHGLAEVVVR